MSPRARCRPASGPDASFGPETHAQAANLTCGNYVPSGRAAVLMAEMARAGVIERYASRWSIEVAIQDSKQIFGTGQARNRTARAVERTVPFEIACQAAAVTWYATGGRVADDLNARRRNSPWYTSKAEPSTSDMTAPLRRVLIATDLRHLALTSRHAKNSTLSVWPGKKQRHNCESRVFLYHEKFSPKRGWCH